MGENSSYNDVFKELGRRWRQLSEEEKKPYKEMGEKDKQRYYA